MVRRSLLLLVAAVSGSMAVGVSAAPAAGGSAASSAAAWQEISSSHAASRGTARPAVRPDRFRAFTLDRPALEGVLGAAPRQWAAAGSPESLTISLPAPGGGFERFAVQRSSVMAPQLAARHPEISTYSGTGIDVPGSTVHLDLGSLGLHASVLGPEGAWYIDPYFHREQSAYVSYFGRDLTRNPHGAFVERNGGPPSDPFADFSPTPQAAPATVPLRVYRLALASDPSYAAYFGAANVTSAKVTLMNRVDQPYEDDLAVQMRLIGANDKLNLNTDAKMTGANGPCGTAPCFTAAQTAFCSGGTLVRNDTVIGQIVGARNYDIGHIALGVNGGGVAAVGVVGRRFKAEGCTGVPTPEGDLYAIDYVAHEMGHQFGGQHTFNGNMYACGFGNRNAATSVEPGSGSTIMAYAGICRQDDLQPHSDPYFSERSIDELGGYVTSDRNAVDEVQNVALRNFDTDGDSFTLTFNGATSAPIVRGTNYNAAGIKAAVQSITGGTVTVVGFGGSGQPDDTGFEVAFGGALAQQPVAKLSVTDPSGMSGFVGEIVRGGPVQNGGSTVIDSGNHAPVVNAPSLLRIPARTPFRLSGGSVDADGDAVTYSWEQNDIGAGSGTRLVNNTKRTGPLFRQFSTRAVVDDDGTLQSPSPGENATTPDPTRYFPDLAQIVRGNTNAATGSCPAPTGTGAVAPRTVDCFSEFLPTSDWVGIDNDRMMHFRLVARDGNPVAGGVGTADTAVRIVPAAGPFRVTSQASDGTLTGRTQIGVTWDPAGTAAPPINTSDVAIRLSIDDGRTFPLVLLGSTPNDGSATVEVPNVNAQHARIKVEALGNVFFDLSHGDLRIKAQDDNDGDGIPNAQDGCPSVPASTPTGCPEKSRTVSIRYSATQNAFLGELTSSEPACTAGATVRVRRRRPGPDQLIGIDGSSPSGHYTIADPTPVSGTYYAKAAENTVFEVATCRKAMSDPLVIN